MAEAIAESRAYEQSREDEARRRRFAAEDAALAASRVLGVERTDARDHRGDFRWRPRLRHRAAPGDRGLRGRKHLDTVEAALGAAAHLVPPVPRLPRVRAGLCSSCAAVPVEARFIDERRRDLCVPNLVKQFRRMGRNRRRKRLPAPPSLGDMRVVGAA